MTPSFPPVRACIFDVDGLLINSEDIYTDIYNSILHDYGRPDYPWTIKATQQSRGTTGTLRLLQWADLNISIDEWKAKERVHHHLFAECKPLPGALDLLDTLSRCTDPQIKIALASSAGRKLFDIKTSHISGLASAFPPSCRVFGDDPDMSDSRKKPCPDIFLLALDRINERCKALQEDLVKPEECLVFEDSIAGVEAGRKAGMRVIWVPHPGLARVCKGMETDVLDGRTEADGVPPVLDQVEKTGEAVELQAQGMMSEDGWAEQRLTLASFPFEDYGIHVNTPCGG